MTKRTTMICASVLALAIATSAHAQAPAAAADDAVTSTRAEDLGDIVVTARRREENLQRVPQAITAFSSDMIERQQIRSLIDLTSKTPGLNFTSNGTPYNATVTIRGQTKTILSAAQSAVVSYVNEVPLPTFGSGLPTFDLASIQVLKGPQGTYFGRNTTGGAILVTTQAPTHEFGGYGSVLYGSYNWLEMEGAVNVPIVSDKVSLRLSTKITDRDGYTKNLSRNGHDFDNVDDRAFRASLLIEPTDNIRNVTVFDHLKGHTVSAVVLLDALPGGLGRTPALAGLFDCGTSPSCDVDLAVARQRAEGPRKVRTSVVPKTNFTSQGISNTTTIDLGGIQAKNIFGYRRVRFDGVVNADGSDMKIIDSYQQIDDEQITDELQFSGKLFGDRLEWLAGGFYLKVRPKGIDGSARQIGVAAATPNDNMPFVHSYLREGSKALYAQLIYDLGDVVPGVKINGGYRRTWDKLSVCSATNLYAQARITEDQCLANPGFTGSRKSNTPTWTVGADWQANEDVFLYFTARRGYRAGGINSPRFAGALTPFQTYEAEVAQDMEAGAKLNWNLDDVRGRFNIAAFRTRITDVQSTVSALPGNFMGAGNVAGISPIANFGKVVIKGVEIDASVTPVANLTLSASGAYIRPRFTDYTLPALFSTLLPPNPLITNQPKYSGTASIDYSVPLGDAGTLAVNVNAYKSSKISYGVFAQPSYELVNARIDWKNFMGNPIDLSVFARNLFDKDYISGPTINVASLTYVTGNYGAPRMFGVQARYRFGD